MSAGAGGPGLVPVPPVPPGPGDALRVTLVSPRPVPDPLVAHVGDLLAARSSEVAHARGTLGPLRTVGWALRVRDADDASDDEADPASSLAAAALALRDEVRGPATALGVDVAVTTGAMAERGPGLIVTDVDSTLFGVEVIDLVAEHAGVSDQVAEVTERAMSGGLDFAESLAQRVALVAGLEAEPVLERVRGDVVYSPGAREMFLRARDAGVPTGVVSGGFVEVVGPLVAEIGVRHVAANRFEVDGGRLTGRTTGPVIDRAAKASHVRRWADELGVELGRVLTAGDGANDLDLLDVAGLGVAYGGRPVVVERADAFVTGDRLDTVLALTGVADVED